MACISSDGISLHFISLRLRSTEDSANLLMDILNNVIKSDCVVLYRIHAGTKVYLPMTELVFSVLLPTNTFRRS